MRAYLTILRLPGALAFCAAALLARAGGAMMGIGVVLMVSLTYGSYGLAGAVAAANSAAWALGAAVLSNLVDRHGQRRIMLPAAFISTVLLALLVVLAVVHAPAWLLFFPAAGSGFAGGSPGALVRARWNHILDDPDQLHSALALESTLDEVTFIVGPMAATALATGLFPEAGLVAVCVVTVVGALVFYSQRATEPPVEPSSRERSPDRPPWWRSLLLAMPGVAPAVAISLTIGMVFGSIDVTVVAATRAWEAAWSAGLVLAAISLGSALAGLTYGSRVWASPLPRRYLIGVVAFGVGTSVFLFAGSPVALGVCGFVAGMAIAPTLINANSVVQQLVPQSRLTEGLAWLGTSIGLGASIGSAVAGHTIDLVGYHGGFWTVTACAVMAIIVAAATIGVIRRHLSA